MALARPDATEMHPYYQQYVALVPDGDILDTLSSQITKTVALLGDLSADQQRYRYASDKWSVRETIGHLIDTERVFGVRALCFARRDPASLPGFEQDDYAVASNAHERPLGDLLNEYQHVRASHVAMFGSFDDDMALRRGIASEREFTVRAFAWIIAGHELHHRNVLQERYLNAQ